MFFFPPGCFLNLNIYSASSSKSFLFTNERAPRAYHQQSHSASAVGTHHESTEDITIIGHTPPIPQSSLLSLNNSPHQYSATLLPSLNRSRTSDLGPDDLTSVDRVPLSRCCTAPAVETFADVLAVVNGRHDSATRQYTTTMTSANKLTRMGFSAKDGSQAPPLPLLPVPSISLSPRGGHEQKSRFGIKSLFKGKS